MIQPRNIFIIFPIEKKLDHFKRLLFFVGRLVSRRYQEMYLQHIVVIIVNDYGEVDFKIPKIKKMKFSINFLLVASYD